MILVVGSINMDICFRVQDIPGPGETVMSLGVAKNPGGKGANQAVAAAKLGAEVTMLGCVGKDEHGKHLLDSLAAAGVDTGYILQKEDCDSSTAFICIANSGENTIVVDSSANMHVSGGYLRENAALFRQAEYCVLQREIPVDTVRSALALCREYGVKTVLNPSPLSGFEMDLLQGVDYLIPNEHEAAALLGKAFEEATEQDWFAFMEKYDIKHMIITLGKVGCRYYHAPQPVLQVKSAPRKAVDTTGAGDTFLGATVAALSRGFGMKEALEFANTAAGIAVTRPGAQQAMPDREEVERALCECC